MTNGETPNANLVRGRYIICRALDTDRVEMLTDAAILQINGAIEAVGPYDALSARYRDVETIGSCDHLIIPGLVNSHHHIGLTPVQKGIEDLPLEIWLIAQLGCRPVDGYLDTLYSAFEMIGSGVTAVQHLDPMRGLPPDRWAERGCTVVKAYQDIGMRVSYALCTRDQNHLVYAENAQFLSTLPPALADEVRKMVVRNEFALGDIDLRLLAPMIELYRRDPGVRIWLAPINLERSSDALLKRTHDLAANYGIGIHLHLSETPYQKVYAQRRFGKSAVEHLNDIGFLDANVTLGHAVWVTEHDLELIAAHGCSVCHNASSNLRLRSGIAPLRDLLRRKIPVALGIDEAGLNDDRDMLQEMRLVKHLHARPGLSEAPLTSAQIFQMATEHGARAIGFGDQIGRIEVGRQADLVLINYKRMTNPYREDGLSVIDEVVYRAKNADVEAVIIGGHVVFKDRKFVSVDRCGALARLSASLQAPLTAEDSHRKDLAHALIPYVKKFYADWKLPPTDPFYPLNSRT